MNFELEKEQKLAFNRLKKAYTDCKKLKILLVNQYGTLHAYNGKLVIDFADDIINPRGNPIYYDDFKKHSNNDHVDNIDVGRADDEGMWMVGLSDKGLNIYNELEKDDNLK